MTQLLKRKGIRMLESENPMKMLGNFNKRFSVGCLIFHVRYLPATNGPNDSVNRVQVAAFER
jgi:hypothetical protein